MILSLCCGLAWCGNALYAVGRPGGALKEFSPALVALGSAAFLIWHCNQRYGRRALLFFMFTVVAIGWGFETLSVLTGVPFGLYHYTGIMAPFLGHVPVFVLPAYLFMGYASWSMATLFAGVRSARLSAIEARTVPALAAFFMLLWDASMDPLRATVEGRWIWADGGTHLGVPLSNFVGWFVVTWCMFGCFAAYLRHHPPVLATRADHGPAFRGAIPLIYACYAAEYLLNPFTGHGHGLAAAGPTDLAVQEIYCSVAVFAALTLGPALLAGLWLALGRPRQSRQPATWGGRCPRLD